MNPSLDDLDDREHDEKIHSLDYTFPPVSDPHQSSGKQDSNGPYKQLFYTDPTLDEEQKYILHCVIKEMENLFITGPSGTGKTEMIPILVRELQANRAKVVVTSANTSTAAQLGCKTIQQFCGLGRLDHKEDYIEKKCQLDYMRKIWNNLNVLIIDDVSALPPLDLKKILYIAQLARNVKNPIQWILIGDGLSLAPPNLSHYKNKSNLDLDFCFQLPEWDKLIHRHVVLTRNKRQGESLSSIQTQQPLVKKKYSEFVDILNDIRLGANHQREWVEFLNARLGTKSSLSSTSSSNSSSSSSSSNSSSTSTSSSSTSSLSFPYPYYTRLYVKQEHVVTENNQQLKKLPTSENIYVSQKGFQIGDKVSLLTVPKKYQHLYENPTPSVNEIQKNELLRALERSCPVDSTLVLKRGAFVILMATLNFQNGLVKGAQGVVIGFTSDKYHYPVVQFIHGLVAVIRSYMWSIPYSNEGKMWYSQIPLKLGWAYNIYRMRGMTFDRLEIKMTDVFGFGQFYEVLSKVKTLEGVRLLDIHWPAIKSHPFVLEFYQKISRIHAEDYQKWKSSTSSSSFSSSSSRSTKTINTFHDPNLVHFDLPVPSFTLNPGLQQLQKQLQKTQEKRKNIEKVTEEEKTEEMEKKSKCRNNDHDGCDDCDSGSGDGDGDDDDGREDQQQKSNSQNRTHSPTHSDLSSTHSPTHSPTHSSPSPTHSRHSSSHPNISSPPSPLSPPSPVVN